ncbi:hypothetical protein J6590_049399 [Homalodisca vitripennis]|nr:hypothetical protein J6590_049399 [Homalodisca vitripennis]
MYERKPLYAGVKMLNKIPDHLKAGGPVLMKRKLQRWLPPSTVHSLWAHYNYRLMILLTEKNVLTQLPSHLQQFTHFGLTTTIIDNITHRDIADATSQPPSTVHSLWAQYNYRLMILLTEKNVLTQLPSHLQQFTHFGLTTTID